MTTRLEIDEFRAGLNDLLTKTQREDGLIENCQAAVNQEINKIDELLRSTERLASKRLELMEQLALPQPTPRSVREWGDRERQIEQGLGSLPRFLDGAPSRLS